MRRKDKLEDGIAVVEWTYLTQVVDITTYTRTERLLNTYGEKGYELVSTERLTTETILCIFKKPTV